MIDIKMINPADYHGWNQMIENFENASCFHTSNWAKVICESYGYQPTYFIHNDDFGPSAVIPVISISSMLTGRRGVSLPFTDFCDPLLNGKCRFEKILTAIIEYGKQLKWRHIEFRGNTDCFSESVFSEKFITHRVLLCPDVDKLFAGFRSSTCRNIRKAQKMGVEVQIDSSPHFLQTFFKLNCLTRRQHGLPPQPFKFFKNLYKHLISKEFGKIVIATYQNQPVAGAIYLNFGKKALYKYGASDSRFNNLRANNLMMWEAIKWYALQNYSELHMGRTEPAHTGLDQYKSGWNTIRESLFYYKYNIDQKSFVEQNGFQQKSYEKFFSILPIPLLRVFGKIAYRHIG